MSDPVGLTYRSAAEAAAGTKRAARTAVAKATVLARGIDTSMRIGGGPQATEPPAAEVSARTLRSFTSIRSSKPAICGLLAPSPKRSPRRAGAPGYVVLTIITEQGALCETVLGTLPSTLRCMPLLP